MNVVVWEASTKSLWFVNQDLQKQIQNLSAEVK